MMKTRYMYILSLAAVISALGACTPEDYVLTQKDWSTTEYFSPTDETSPSTFYKPAVGYVADPMPFYDPVAENFKIMYLQEYRPNQADTYHPFWCVETQDGANYRSLGELLPCGGIMEQDAALGTGCVVYDETEQTYYTFYTGHGCHPEVTGYTEMVMMATSKDFKTWKKDRVLLLNGGDTYSKTDFRDPCVFKGDDDKYHMVISTKKGGKGTLVEYKSDNLRDWTFVGDFMNMMWDRFYECPDVFKMGDWWYLIYSEMHDAIRRVQYFKGNSLDNLKECTKHDAGNWPDTDYRQGVLDSRGLYAAKTASNGTDRYMWGWCATRPGKDNTAALEWAGSLVAHRLVQHSDGTLTLGEVPGIAAKYSGSVDVKIVNKDDITVEDGKISLSGNSAAIFSRLGKHNRMTFTVKTSGDSDKFGFSFGRGSDSKKYYSLILNPEDSGNRRKINFEEEGADGSGFIENNDSYEFLRPSDNTYNITIVTDNSVCAVYVNDAVCYTNRIYGMSQNCWSINSYGGSIEIENLQIHRY